MSIKTIACHFGIEHYDAILKEGLKAGYQFIDFNQLKTLPKEQKACILRHDIDYMPERAIRFAEIENNLGIRSTYFFQVCAMTYNLRQYEHYNVVRKLAGMGHQIGLHFDLSWANMPWKEVALFCEKDKKVFREITGIDPCEIISFHNPHRFKDLVLNQSIPKIRHTYEKSFFLDIKYISDSQGWYEGCMCQLFSSNKYKVFQFLTHPHIWPDRSTGDFISDMAQMIKLKTDELTQYLIDFHPVCKRNEARFRKEVLTVHLNHSKSAI